MPIIYSGFVDVLKSVQFNVVKGIKNPAAFFVMKQAPVEVINTVMNITPEALKSLIM